MFDESFSEAWRLRYGTEPPSFETTADLLRHRSVRTYSDHPVTEDHIRALFASAQSASTSSNLQLWSAISVQDPERREAIAILCDNQTQVRNAPWFFAFVADHARLRYSADKVGESAAGLDYTEFLLMAVVDAALAAERMVCAAESIGLGICYIGALRNDPEGVRKLLELPDGVFGLFGLCIGWPDPQIVSEIKPRLSQDSVWFREKYDPQPDVDEYNERMREFYLRQNMKGEVTWSMRSGRRVDGSEKSLTGRGVLKDWLSKVGFGRR